MYNFRKLFIFGEKCWRFFARFNTFRHYLPHKLTYLCLFDTKYTYICKDGGKVAQYFQNLKAP